MSPTSTGISLPMRSEIEQAFADRLKKEQDGEKCQAEDIHVLTQQRFPCPREAEWLWIFEPGCTCDTRNEIKLCSQHHYQGLGRNTWHCVHCAQPVHVLYRGLLK